MRPVARKKSSQHLYVGQSGLFAAMSEFLYRGYNVAPPAVDLGEDVFVVRARPNVVTRVQAKSSNTQNTRAGYFAQFNVPLDQLEEQDDPELVYVFPARHDGRWAEFIIIRRPVLRQLRKVNEIGSPDDAGNLVLRLAYTATDVLNKGTSFQPFRNAWEPWPPPLPPD
jgi:hypothetical protein